MELSSDERPTRTTEAVAKPALTPSHRIHRHVDALVKARDHRP